MKRVCSIVIDESTSTQLMAYCPGFGERIQKRNPAAAEFLAQAISRRREGSGENLGSLLLVPHSDT
jgi:hypothetical protein